MIVFLAGGEGEGEGEGGSEGGRGDPGRRRRRLGGNRARLENDVQLFSTTLG